MISLKIMLYFPFE